MTALDEWMVESTRRLVKEYREDVRWHIAKARKALEMGDVEEARWRLSGAKVWRVRAHHWAKRPISWAFLKPVYTLARLQLAGHPQGLSLARPD